VAHTSGLMPAPPGAPELDDWATGVPAPSDEADRAQDRSPFTDATRSPRAEAHSTPELALASFKCLQQ
jgi:hypothetical protein